MATISKEIADRVIAGEFDDDPCGLCVKIVKFTNAWGGESYGAIFQHQRLDTYKETEYVRNPVTYWERKR